MVPLKDGREHEAGFQHGEPVADAPPRSRREREVGESRKRFFELVVPTPLRFIARQDRPRE
jgi:hypothetical protein